MPSPRQEDTMVRGASTGIGGGAMQKKSLMNQLSLSEKIVRKKKYRKIIIITIITQSKVFEQ